MREGKRRKEIEDIVIDSENAKLVTTDFVSLSIEKTDVVTLNLTKAVN